MKKYIILVSFIVFIIGCDTPRDAIIPTHLTRVTKPYNLKAVSDTTKTGRILVKLTWECEDNGNIKNYEITRAFLRSEYDTSQFYPIPPTVTKREFSDSTIAKFTVDSMQYFYKVTVTGEDKFVGPASDFVSIILFRKK